MKRFIIAAVLATFSLWVMAEPVNPQKALLKAKKFVENRIQTSQRNVAMAFALNQNEKGEADLFVYNIGNKNGFVIVAGDDEEDEILGYADNGDFNYSEMPENLKQWFNVYSQYQAVARGTVTKTKSTYHPTDVIAPLIKTKWGQREPFNLYCPEQNGVKCPAGCTAVAMAQVMKYYRYPRQTTTTIPAYKVSTLGITMPELPETSFNWNKMPEVYDEYTPQEYVEEVAKLMLYCGQASDMAYAAGGSGAATWILPERMPLYFGYPNTMHYVYRQAYSEQQWDSLLVNELRNNRPILYTAYTNLRMGHTFICDGYDGNGFYHINWGWDGVGNGYFKISEAFAQDENLNPNIKNYHLSLTQGALIGVKTSGSDDFEIPQETFRVFVRPSLKNGSNYTRKKTSDNFIITLKQSFINTSNVAVKLSHAYGIYNEAGKLVSVVNSSSASLVAGGTKNYEVTNFSFGSGMASGNYKIKAIYKPENSTSWRPMAGTDMNYVDVVIDGLSATLTQMPLANFKVSNVEMDGLYLTFTFDNFDSEFYGPVYLRKLNKNTNEIIQVSTDDMMVDANTRNTFYLFVNPEEGFDINNDTFFLSVDGYSSQYFYTNKTSASDTNLQKTIEVENLNEESNSLVGDKIICRMTVKNNAQSDFNDDVTFSLIDNFGNIVYTSKVKMMLNASQDTVMTYEFPVSAYDRQYQVAANHNVNSYLVDSYTTPLYDVVRGAVYWNKDGELKTKLAANVFEVPEDALAVILRTAYTSNVTPNDNPNTVYMLDKTMPRGLSGKNYVNNSNKGNTLKLTDGYDYFIPEQFVFTSNATYSRVAESGEEISWSTICLPFDVTKVTANGNAVQWKKADDDENESLLILEIGSVENGIPVFQYAQSMIAGKPYVIGTGGDLAGETLAFVGDKATLAPTFDLDYTDVADDWNFTGTHCGVEMENCFVVDGNRFRRVSEAEIKPFQAYFTLNGSSQVAGFNILGGQEEMTMLGDADGNGVVNVIDVTLVIAHVLGENLDVFKIENVDVNNDGIINILDVVDIIDIILSKPH